ncbi:MAG TPA: cytochrome c oxidase assembly protein [Terriglobales bacterium]|nr:cytochrome c oxidase assembly protein [Terriglobales bacterium]
MASPLQLALESWEFPLPLTFILGVTAFLYLRGWLHLRSAGGSLIAAWRVGSFLFGLFLIWAALGSPLAALDEQLLTVHMIQHLLLMAFAPPLILLGAPEMPLLHGLPQRFVRGVVGPLFRWPPVQGLGHALSHPAVCWMAGAVALVAWHIPAAFTLGLRSEPWHVVEHASFFASGLLFWWPVVQPWPSVAVWPRWSMLPYLFLATLPCDILSAFLVFCGRVVYPAYLSIPRQFNISVLQDQQCAGALMWTCITLVYMVPALILTMRLLAVRGLDEGTSGQSQLGGAAAAQRDPQNVELA